MKTTLYLVRHGQTDWNREKKLHGWSDIPLNEAGISEAEALQSHVRALSLDAVYTSPLSRAHTTAEIISRHHNMPLMVRDELKEGGFGVFEGLRWDEIMGHPLIVEQGASHDRYHDRTGKSESIHDIYVRTSGFIDEVLATHREQSVLLVSHSLAIKTMAYHMGLVEKDDIERLVIHHAHLYHIEYDHTDDRYKAVNFPREMRDTTI